MPRVAERAPDTLDPALRGLYDSYTQGGTVFADQFSVLAQVDPAARHLYGMLAELKARAAVPYRYIEIAIVVVSLLNDCPYCVASHAPRLAVEGISEAGANRLLDYADHPELTDIDKLVVRYATEVTRSAQRVPDDLFDALRTHFSEAQLVELTLRIALCGFFNRFNQALQIGEHASDVHA